MKNCSPWPGELADVKLGALTRHWLLYDLVELGELDHARARHAELGRVAADFQQPLYRHAALAWRGVWAGLAVASTRRSGWPATRSVSPSVPRAPDARTHFTAQLVAVRREQGRLDELLPDIERLARGDSHAAAWRTLAPLAHLDAGDRASSPRRLRLRRGPGDRGEHALAHGHELRCARPRSSSATPTAPPACLSNSPRSRTTHPGGAPPGTPAPYRRLLGRTAVSRAGATTHASTSRRHSHAMVGWRRRRSRANALRLRRIPLRREASRPIDGAQHAACRRRNGAPPGNDRRRRASGATRLNESRGVRDAPRDPHVRCRRGLRQLGQKAGFGFGSSIRRSKPAGTIETT